MAQLLYMIDKREVGLDVGSDTVFQRGQALCLGDTFGDPTNKMSWFKEGFTTLALPGPLTHAVISRAVGDCVAGIIERLTNKPAANFTLEDYHHFVDADLHRQVFGQTRQIAPEGFGIDSNRLIAYLSRYFGVPLGLYNRAADEQQRIIVRINRPGSHDYNPPHKDVYEDYDKLGCLSPMINVWIPVCGIGDGVGLPLAVGSHTLSEADISRTKAGCVIHGQRYSVNCVESWAGRRDMITLSPKPTEMLLFSSNLIHGYSRNLHKDTTRVSLEFRLYQQAE